MSRREFGKRVKAAAFKRCGGPDNPKCEKCGTALEPGRFALDHVVPDGLGGEPTLENCMVLCSPCHTEKTERQDKPVMRKADAQRDAHWNIKTPRRKIPSPPRAPKKPSRQLPERRSLYRDAS